MLHIYYMYSSIYITYLLHVFFIEYTFGEMHFPAQRID